MSSDPRELKLAFANALQNPATDLCRLLGWVEDCRTELHTRLEQTNAVTTVDNGGPITLRCEEIDDVD